MEFKRVDKIDNIIQLFLDNISHFMDTILQIP